MSIPAAYLGIIMIWSTTPLTVKWSGEGPGYIFGVTSRMMLGAVLSYVILRALKVKLPRDRQSQVIYILSAMSTTGAMFCVYWSARFIPSGFISVLFASAPIFTSILSAMLLAERSLTPGKLAGFALGFAGIALVFRSGLSVGGDAWMGILGTLVAVAIFSFSSVLLKRIGTDLHAMAINTGGLLYSSVLLSLVWWGLDGHLPQSIPMKAGLSIVYLGVIGTAIGFAVYMYLLKAVPASSLAMTTLVSPVTALWLGKWLNHEQADNWVWYGTAMIFAGLALHQQGHRLAWRRAANRRAQSLGAEHK